jgi:hypothetical protein
MRILCVVAVSALALAMGCNTELSSSTSAAEWSLVSDARGGLVDPSHPEFGAYPNPSAVSSMNLVLHKSGEICARAGTRDWCGSAVQGIPYSSTAFIRNGRLCLRVVDLYGNDVAERCGIQPPPGSVVPETAAEVPADTGCIDARARDGSPCQVCSDADGTVIMNTCNAPAGQDEFADTPSDCSDPATAADLGVTLFADAFNAGLQRIGLDLRIAPTGAPSSVEALAEDEISISEGCAGVLEFLDDHFSDDHEGTDDWVFGPDAIAECLEEGRCRIGQLVTRTMAEACMAIPAGCDTRTVEMAIVGSGGEAVETVCEDGAGTAYHVMGDASFECRGSPLVVDLDGNGLALRGPLADAPFRLMGAGLMSVGWLAGNDDALLALDVDGDGRIASGRELFGEVTGGWAPDGFTALARHDDNDDGVIDRNDAVFESLLLWRDDGDAVSQPGELIPLHGTDIDRIALRATAADETDAAGNVIGLSSEATGADGRTIPVHDVWFRIGR